MDLQDLNKIIHHFEKKGDTEVVKFYKSMRRSLKKVIVKEIKRKLNV